MPKNDGICHRIRNADLFDETGRNRDLSLAENGEN